MKIIPSLSAKDTLEILDKQWLTTNDLKKLACVGTNKVKELKKSIIEMIHKEDGDNYYLPSGQLPTDKVIKYLKINVNYLKKIAKEKDTTK